MNKINLIIFYGLLFINYQKVNCQMDTFNQKLVFNQELANELKRMAEIDQIAGWIPLGDYKSWSNARWDAFKDSVFRTNKKRIEEIFNQYGFPGYNLVGKDGEKDFWVIVQHCDLDPEFQIRVLDKMKTEVERNNANTQHFAFLTDRVKLNMRDKQIYGTQVAYNSYGQAYPRNLADSASVNERRIKVGLGPIEEYLNRMTQSHYDMNKEYYNKKGISEPKLYKTEN